MPTDAPTPITPEGKRAAERIRSLFFMVAAANLVLVAVVIWQGYFGKPDKSRPKEPASAMEELTDRSITAYNAGDTHAFSALFTTGAPPDPAMHHAESLRDFGKILGKKFASQPEAAAGDSATLIHEVTCEKDPHARLVTKFTRVKDAMKLAEWSIKRP